MKTNYVVSSNPMRFSKDPGDVALIAAANETVWAKKSAAKRTAQVKANQNAEANRNKFTPDTQPRNNDGKFRKILARLKTNLGGEATEQLAKKIESAEAAQIAGNYEEARKNGIELIKMIDNISDGSMPKGVTKNLRQGASDLGKVLAYLPLPQGDANAKIRFTDLPPATADLVRSMIKKVQEQLAPDVAEKYVSELNEFMSGSRTMNSDEMASNLNKLLRVLA
jgi:carboxylesterase type B